MMIVMKFTIELDIGLLAAWSAAVATGMDIQFIATVR